MVAAVALVLPAALGSTVTVFGVTLATSAGLTAVGIALNVAGSLALSYAVSELTRPDIAAPDPVRPENIKVNSKVAAGVRYLHYGLVKVGGNVVFHRARDGVSYRLIVHGHGEASQVLQYYLNEEPVDLGPDGYVLDGQYQHGGRSRVRILGRLGLVPSAHYAEISAIWPEWTSSHRLDGLFTSLIMTESVPAERYRSMYPNNEPNLTVLAQGRRCFDPRTGQTAFTENMALAIADLMASPDVFNRPDALDVQDVIDAANIADRDVPMADGGTEKLFRIGGSFPMNERPQNMLNRMLSACAGKMYLKPSGKIGLAMGVWEDPQFTLTYGDILEVQEVNSGPDILDRYNELPARFNSHDLGHVEVDAEPWRDDTRVAEDGEVLTGPEKSMLLSPSHRQTRHCLKVHTERDNPRQSVSLTCKPRALPAIYEHRRPIRLDVPQLGLVGNYIVRSHSISFEKGQIRTVAMRLDRVDSAAFGLSLAEQGAVQQLPEPATSSGVPVPENVTAAAAGIQTSATSFVAGIAVGWQEAPSDALTPRLRYSRGGKNNWKLVALPADETSATITGLTDGLGYDLELSFVTPGGVVGDAVIVTNVIAAAVTDPPAAPSNLAVSDAGGGAALIEMTAATSDGLWKTEILRDGVLVGVVYAGPGADIAFIDTSGAGVFDWAARSVNVSSINSTSDAGPVSATIA